MLELKMLLVNFFVPNISSFILYKLLAKKAFNLHSIEYIFWIMASSETELKLLGNTKIIIKFGSAQPSLFSRFFCDNISLKSYLNRS